MIKKFDDFINLDKRIGKLMIIGKEGAGKTLLASFIGVKKMLRGQQDCWKSYDEVEKYNGLGYTFSMNYEHLLFSNIDIKCAGTGIPDRRSYVVDPFRVGLWCEEYDTDFFPPYTCFIIDEAHRPFNAYMWSFVRPEISAFWETSRQGKYDLIMATNRPNLIVNTIRDLCNRIIFCYKKCEEIVKDNVVVGHKLFIREFENYEGYVAHIKGSNTSNFEEYELILDKCMYECYKTDNCKILHLKGRFGQDFSIFEHSEITSVDEVETYSDAFGITAPEGYYYKKGNFDKKNTKVEAEPEPEEEYLF